MDDFFGRDEDGLAELVNELFAIHYRIGSILLANASDWLRAANNAVLQHDWARTAPQFRAALLLAFSWSSRVATIAAADTAAGLYANDLHRHACEFTGGPNEFHGMKFPLLPYPGPAGILASSLAFDRDDLNISLETALILAAANGPSIHDGGQPVPGALHIPTGPHPTDPHAPRTLVWHFPTAQQDSRGRSH
ncbi:hypothetical protein [Nocardia transvalensis]|uniref:hypothetical protein n=1 Tax=Nocardia transvalensis TaxID=37333 RepID=UPI001892EEEE|nr:hypothetical protein [Nocardia transvalensis]MBF6333477.1 hypothetical protein [Nocardia transvalensis]